MDKTFIGFRTDEGSLFLNLYQIVSAYSVAGEGFEIHMSDGHAYRLTASEEVTGQLLAIIGEMTMTFDGQVETVDKQRVIDSGLKLIKPEDEQ